MILTLALSIWTAPPTPIVIPAPPTIDVVIMSRSPPRRLRILRGACSQAEFGRVDEVQGAKKGLKICRGSKAQQRCSEAPSADLVCDGSASVDAPGIPARTYGRRFKIRSLGGFLRVVSAVDLEGYVRGVADAELSFAPPEAFWAQEVVARTFALKAQQAPRHEDGAVCDLTHCQAFSGVPRRREAEHGQPLVLVDHEHQLADVFYHSTCGGRSLPPSAMWPNIRAPDLTAVDDLDPKGRPYCRVSPHFHWVFEVDERKLAAALSGAAGRPLDPSSLALVAQDPDFARWKVSDQEGAVLIGGEVMHLELSRIFGFGAVKSSRFVATRAGANFRLSGFGLGHRVGLCQMGAIARANAGATGFQILSAYFPKLEYARVNLQ
ncbi:MAG: SpoIID/LytB domain-containing protein [Myxococcota bacterium]